MDEEPGQVREARLVALHVDDCAQLGFATSFLPPHELRVGSSVVDEVNCEGAVWAA